MMICPAYSSRITWKSQILSTAGMVIICDVYSILLKKFGRFEVESCMGTRNHPHSRPAHNVLSPSPPLPR